MTEHFIDERLLTNQLLNGVTMSVVIPEQKVAKERVFWISPGVDKICWQTRNQTKIYYIPVEAITVHFFSVYEYRVLKLILTREYKDCLLMLPVIILEQTLLDLSHRVNPLSFYYLLLSRKSKNSVFFWYLYVSG